MKNIECKVMYQLFRLYPTQAHQYVNQTSTIEFFKQNLYTRYIYNYLNTENKIKKKEKKKPKTIGL